MTTIILRPGATEGDIQAALSNLPSGGTLVLPPNETILITSGLKIDAAAKSITLDLNGSTLQQAGNASVISVNGGMTAPTVASLDRDDAGQLTVTSSALGKVAVGDYVKIISDDVLPNDHGDTTRLGQAMKVLAVNGSSVTLEGDLLYGDLYQTNIRVSHFKSGTIEIGNGTVRGDQSQPTWTNALVHIRSTVDTHIDNLTVRDGNSMGINFVNTVSGLVTQSAAINLKDDTTKGQYGYGVHSASAINTTVDGFYAEKVRHAVDDNSNGVTAGHRDPSRYGADIGLTATNVVANSTTAFAFSWHSEGRQGYYGDSVVFNSHGVISFRGMEHVAENISGSGNTRGIQFFEYGNGDGQRNHVENMQLKETGAYVYYNSGKDPKNNTISNSTFDMTKVGYKLAPDPSVTLHDTVVRTTPAGDELIVGTVKDDRLLGGAGDDTILGGSGRDYIWGGQGADRLTGGAGADRFVYLAVNEGGDVITDFGGGDVIDLSAIARKYSWTGDVLEKGYIRFVQSGQDTLVMVDVTGGANSLTKLATLTNVNAATLNSAAISTQIMVTDYGPGGPLVPLDGVPSAPPVPGGIGDPFAEYAYYQRIAGTMDKDTIKGSEGNDIIFGGAGDDRLFGQAGDDVMVGGAGADFFHGGGGDDTVSYALSNRGLVVSLLKPSLNTGEAAGDTYSQIRNLTGTQFDDELHGNDAMNAIRGGWGNDRLFGHDGSDTLLGGAGDDVLDGGLKNDVLDGGDGNDWLFGSDGYDTLTGGAGADTFVFDLAQQGSFDTITDFEVGVDRIALIGTGLTSLSDFSFLTAPGARPTAPEPAIMFDKETGAFHWDVDGDGAEPRVMLGKVAPGVDLTLWDFVLA